MDKRQRLIKDLEEKKCLKLIAGIDNFDKANVLQIAAVASQTKASCVDICADETIISEALANFPEQAICVSSVKPEELRRAAELGADMLELGNYEALHKQGVFYTADEILELSHEIMDSVNSLSDKPLVSITIPGHLEIKEQAELAQRLAEMNIDIIQTEGASLVDAKASGALGNIQKVSITLANTVEICKAVESDESKTPYVLTASGINPDTAALALASGASGIGVGKYVNKLESSIEMLAATKALQEALEKVSINSKSKEQITV